MATGETTISVEGEFWRILDRIGTRTRKSKRAILWQMLIHFLEDEAVQRYLEFDGVDWEKLLADASHSRAEWEVPAISA